MVAVPKTVRIHEIAKSIGISSAELIAVCHRAGLDHITHPSNSVPAGEAESIRNTVIRLYRPKEKPVLKKKTRPPKKEKAKPKEEKEKEEPKKKTKDRLPSTKHVKPVPPPIPTVPQAHAPKPKKEEAPAPKKGKGRRRDKARDQKKTGTIKKRTIVFKHPSRPRPQIKKETEIEMVSPVSVRELSERLGISASSIIKELMFEHDVRASINHTISDDLVQMIGLSHEVEITLIEPQTAEDKLLQSLPKDKQEDLAPRPPVVALLGHVDHGKTSILDQIRNARVAESEAGGITQDIGAWQVQKDGQSITFIDTPGHEAFTAMRARGARTTDVVVLVVAADDGVMPQTVEAIDHARAAGVPIVVAINKVDKPDADPTQVRHQLAAHELTAEEWGGEVGCVDVSAVTGQGIDDLLERITLEAELLEVKANPKRAASGAVLEARMKPGRGVVTDIIVQNGTLHQGDMLVCGNAFGTARSIYDDRGREIDRALPGQPVAISGLNKVPEAGETFLVVQDQDVARKVADERQQQLRKKRLRQNQPKVTLENLYDRIQSGKTRQLNIIIKADVQGSLDPIVKSLHQLGTDEVAVKIIHSGVGHVSTSDVLLAEASDALILAFRVREDEKVREMLAAYGVEVRRYDVIYHMTEEIRQGLEGLLEPEEKEERIGLAEVRQVFEISRYGRIAGCYVTEGSLLRSGRVRVIRDEETIHDGPLASLRHEKDDVRQVDSGRECGINIQGFNDFQVGDVIECYRIVTVQRTLADSAAGETQTA